MRDYAIMRQVIAAAAKPHRNSGLGDFYAGDDAGGVNAELKRLNDDGLIDADLKLDWNGVLCGGSVGGLTDEGKAFFRLIENPDVWRIVHSTLETANVDISYPLLKEVCEEIVKRYVTSFIPDIKPCR